jgi:hypothetical protein
MGAISDLVLMGDGRRFRAWVLRGASRRKPAISNDLNRLEDQFRHCRRCWSHHRQPLMAVATFKFRVESFADSNDLVRRIFGAALMGAGGAMALGCTVGQGITGMSMLTVGSVIAWLCILRWRLSRHQVSRRRIIREGDPASAHTPLTSNGRPSCDTAFRAAPSTRTIVPARSLTARGYLPR